MTTPAGRDYLKKIGDAGRLAGTGRRSRQRRLTDAPPEGPPPMIARGAVGLGGDPAVRPPMPSRGAPRRRAAALSRNEDLRRRCRPLDVAVRSKLAPRPPWTDQQRRGRDAPPAPPAPPEAEHTHDGRGPVGAAPACCPRASRAAAGIVTRYENGRRCDPCGRVGATAAPEPKEDEAPAVAPPPPPPPLPRTRCRARRSRRSRCE